MKQLLFLLLICTAPMFASAEEKVEERSDATWEETITFINQHSSFNIKFQDEYNQKLVGKISDNGAIKVETICDERKSLESADLTKLKNVDQFYDGFYLKFTKEVVFAEHFPSGETDQSQYLAIHITDKGKYARMVKAFEHLAYLATEQRKQEHQDSTLPELIKVTGGTFTMGDEHGVGDDDEQPTHEVTLTDYYIGKTEVTVAQYRAYCNSTGVSMPEEPSWGWNSNDPIVNVPWNDAINYCDWLSEKLDKNITLPTEAQWEFAARGGNQSKGYKYAGGRSIATAGWYEDNSEGKAHAVAQKKANELGLYDMCGNVWEWCLDWYKSDYYATSPSKSPKTQHVEIEGCFVAVAGMMLRLTVVLPIASAASKTAGATTTVFVWFPFRSKKQAMPKKGDSPKRHSVITALI